MTNETDKLAADFVVEYASWKATGEDLGLPWDLVLTKPVQYLLQNGFTQSLTDAAAFSKEQKAGKSDDDVKAMATTARQKRFEAILTGEVGARVAGPRLPTIDRVMRDIAEERVRAICVAKGVPMAKGDVLKSAMAKIAARFEDDIRAEAERRMSAATDAASADVDDILSAA